MRGRFTVGILYLFLVILAGCTAPISDSTPTPLPNIAPSATVVKNTVTPSATPFPPTPTFEIPADDFFVPNELVVAVSEAPLTFDPAYSNNRVGAGIIEQVYEPLITYNRENSADFVPQLAAAMPSVSDDGLTYNFTIREGIHFQDGTLLTTEDVAYSLQRGLLQGGPRSFQYRLATPLLGVQDVTELLGIDTSKGEDIVEELRAADAAALVAVCERVKQAIRAEGNTVQFTLATPSPDFLSDLAGWWASVLNQEWAIAHGGWDGNCATWQHTYEVALENNSVHTTMNGTGPYMLSSWSGTSYISLDANPTYWRTEQTGPAWQAGPVGIAKVPGIRLSITPDDHDRVVTMLAADADITTIPPDAYDDLQPIVRKICPYDFITGHTFCTETSNDGYLKVYTKLPHWEFDHSARGYTIQLERQYLYAWNYNYYYNPATAFPYFYALIKERE